MQSGELFVTGKNKVLIELNKHPDKMVVHFKGKAHVVPCNHNHHDFLEWEVYVEHDFFCKNRYFLIIKWDVTNFREIKWSVYY